MFEKCKLQRNANYNGVKKQFHFSSLESQNICSFTHFPHFVNYRDQDDC